MKSWEKLRRIRSDRVYIYYDSAGNATTIGWGHFIHYGKVSASDPSEKLWMPGISFDEADQLFDSDLYDVYEDVVQYVNVPLKQSEFDALVSLRFTLKPQTFARSQVVADVNNKAYSTAVGSFTKVGKLTGGLMDRRFSESLIFGFGIYLNHN